MPPQGSCFSARSARSRLSNWWWNGWLILVERVHVHMGADTPPSGTEAFGTRSVRAGVVRLAAWGRQEGNPDP